MTRTGTALLLVVTLTACAPGTTTDARDAANPAAGATTVTAGPGQPVRGREDLVEGLRARGATVAEAGSAQQPFLAPAGTRLQLSGGHLTGPAQLEVYEYDSAAAADADAEAIDRSGSPRTYQISWIAPPHFYRADRLIVLYVGADPNVTTLLTGLLGPQFAGR